MAWRRPGAKPLSEPMMVRSLTHICVSLPQWVNHCWLIVHSAARHCLNHCWFIVHPAARHYLIHCWFIVHPAARHYLNHCWFIVHPAARHYLNHCWFIVHPAASEPLLTYCPFRGKTLPEPLLIYFPFNSKTLPEPLLTSCPFSNKTLPEWTIAELLSIWLTGTNTSHILPMIKPFSLKNIYLKMFGVHFVQTCKRYLQTSNISHTFIGNQIRQSNCHSWSITCRCCSNYIFSLRHRQLQD